MELHKLKPIKGNKKSGKRVGRGYSSGRGGHTSGRGNKGQKARKSGGGAMPFGFEGGQVPIYKKLPQMGGFKNHNSKKILSVNTSILDNFKEDMEVTPKVLQEAGIIKFVPKHGVKLLLLGKVKHKLKLSGFLYSSSAREALTKAGCILS